ncbi:tRNA glutamyl-Q(34) synthetase GluQRS [Marinomonas sp. 15G1-11]|uniref:tRNA glutamyl-Q(34) synthetase GluQRS n=1 Tax=Marinomonas phaeophyticola TaxID=3004091 RepID=A0ABT4K0I5_9GAMM|nr:tRNA glutamyl-Q(34) synthetase GluQRS [Marinomonas sp. 15G1-11]MCZ2723528.1 tRNA glutamyl-Q(34) synthetase GluQRS [Marinomonas sp. 15G1-11]
MHSHYVGRFAPSPTGPLHLGSLVSALASYLDAKKNHGKWLIRIEDVDQTRCKPLYTEAIVSCLSSYGLESDGPIALQSERSHIYQDHLDILKKQHQVFPCNCTRQTLQSNNNQHIGACNSDIEQPHSWRLLSQEAQLHHQDPIQGNLHFSLNKQTNCPVLKRKDQFFSYQLAVVIDDHLQKITHIVRGADLLDTMDTQLYLYTLFNWQPPSIAHTPLILDIHKQKISKQNHARALPHGELSILKTALSYLCIPESHSCSIQETLIHAIQHWTPGNLKQQTHLEIKTEHAHLATQN